MNTMNKAMTEWEKFSIKLENTVWKSKAASIALTVLALLDEQGISKQELAVRMNVKPQYVSRIVKGKANITLETLVKLERALGATIVEIVDPTEVISFHSQTLFNMDWQNNISLEDTAETNSIATVSSDTEAHSDFNKAA